MRIILIILISLFLILVAFSQDRKPNDAATVTIGNPVTAEQLLRLPQRDAPPTISLKQALKIAENFIKNRKIDVSSRYLFEAKWVSDKLGEEPSWHFWWVEVRSFSRPKGDLRIKVSMEGKVEVNSSL